ncbi:MAG: hypothetical protein GEV04_07215 [Actinophytocola sp.]|nr:hypothetical protein [Actinophytocola sp.]
MSDTTSPLRLTATSVTRTAAELGESPLWDGAAGLRWVDVPGQRLCTLTPDGTESTVELSRTVTAIGRGESDALVAVTSTGFGTLDPGTGTVIDRVRVLDDATISMNDGTVDASGACWAGSAVRDGSRRGALYRFDGTEATTQLTGLGMSNGLEWSPAADVLYHVDTTAGTLTAWECDVADGKLGEGRLLRSVPSDVGLPDGLMVDADGDIWLAVWGQGEVWRIDARTGDTTGIVTVPTRYPTSCAFGGDSLSTLFITSAAHENAPGGGLVYAVDLPVKGRQPHQFGGTAR